MSSTLHIVLDEQQERRIRRLKEEMDVTWAEFMEVAAENRRAMLEAVRDPTEDEEYGGPFVELLGSLEGKTDDGRRTGTEILRAERERERQKEREMLERLGIKDSESDE